MCKISTIKVSIQQKFECVPLKFIEILPEFVNKEYF